MKNIIIKKLKVPEGKLCLSCPFLNSTSCNGEFGEYEEHFCCLFSTTLLGITPKKTSICLKEFKGKEHTVIISKEKEK
jgi:hypothetical protein